MGGASFNLGRLMITFALNPEADINGTYRIGEVALVPRRLVERFGPPGESDGYKVSGMYCFEDSQGRIYTLYDWKETSLFNDGMDEGDESFMPTPDEFWGNENPTTLQIGGRDDGDVKAFTTWLAGEVA